MILQQQLGPHRKTHKPILCGILSSLLFGLILFGFACGTQTTKRGVLSRGNPQSIVRPVFYPKTEAPYPAILVLPEAGTLVSSHADETARNLAGEGYVAQAVSYAERISGKILSDQNEANRKMRVISDSLGNLRHQAGVDPKRIGIIGYSLGGAFAIHLASGAEGNGVRAVVIYYGIYRFPDIVKSLQVPVLAFQGDADIFQEFIGNAYEMQRIAQENHRQFDVVLYKNAKHGFDFKPSGAFNAPAASDAWKRMVAFLDNNLKPR